MNSAICIGILSSASGCGSSPVKDHAVPKNEVPTDTPECEQPLPWVTSALAVLADARSLYDQRANILCKLQELNRPPPDAPDDVVIAWIKRAGPGTKELVKAEIQTRGKVEDKLTLLWWLTSYGHPIVSRPYSILYDHAHQICDEYKYFLDTHLHMPFQDVFEDQLESNVNSINTQYAWNAISVIQKYVWFDTYLIIAGKNGLYVPFSERQQKRYAAKFRQWLNNSPKRVWNNQLKMFTTPDGDRFEMKR